MPADDRDAASSPAQPSTNAVVDAALQDPNRNQAAKDFQRQAQRLALLHPGDETAETGSTQAVEAKYVTPLDPVIETADGKRLPTVPAAEALKLNQLRAELEGKSALKPPLGTVRKSLDGSVHGAHTAIQSLTTQNDAADAPLQDAIAPSHTNPLFPPLPTYGPPSLMRTIQCWFFRISAFHLSLLFLIAIVIGAIVDGVPRIFRNLRHRAMFQDPKRSRPFYEEEMKRRQERRAAEKAWVRNQRGTATPSGEKGLSQGTPPQDGEFVPTEGGPDPLVVDVGYYARRVGLDSETFEVQTEDGFIIELWHIFNPREYVRPSPATRAMRGPDVFTTQPGDPEYGRCQEAFPEGRKKYPVLMVHGLLQSAGAFCTTDDDSFAFYLAKSGYDVWLGNNRCGFHARHTSLQYGDPRMWAWNIRQMGVLDLAALVSRVLAETGFPQLGLIAHSQGTTQTLVALAKEQRPDLGPKISVFCALAPAAYAGPLIGKMYFRFMRLINAAVFRLVFGIHAFIPLMLQAHDWLPPRPFGWLGYHVFSFLFSWTDHRWERDLRDRMFQWAPVYVSAESMRWWLGREGFATQRCILATRQAGELEDREDEEDDALLRRLYDAPAAADPSTQARGPRRRQLFRNLSSFHLHQNPLPPHPLRRTRGEEFAWYDARFPPLAVWVGGADHLVDGRRLLRRFARGREPHVRLVHSAFLPEYEHLDVIWAMDAIERVGKEVREVLWRTASAEARKRCRVPVGCEGDLVPEPVSVAEEKDVPMVASGGRKRMASISENAPPTPGSLQLPLAGRRSRAVSSAAATVASLTPGFAGAEEKGNPFEVMVK